jgi:N-acetylmuramoyl-L-alanine amidase
VFVAKKRLSLRFAALAAGLAAALSGAALATAASRLPDAAAGVLKVRFGGDRAQTRIVIDLDRETSGGDVTFPAPGRIIASLPKISAPAGPLDGAGQGLVRRWLVDREGGQTRLQFDLNADVRVARRFLLPPGDGVAHWRYVIDLESSAKSAEPPVTIAANRLAEPVQPKVTKATTISTLKRRRVVVIDAGHGGRDPGALGASAREKDITLAAARTLKARLEAKGGYRVVMTRDSDVYVALENRVQIARKADADLFISLHADAGPDARTRGASVYTLSEKGAERVAKVLGPQGLVIPASAPSRDRAVSQILFDLTQRSTKNRSAAFAETLMEHVGDETPLLRRSHRDAGYVVLLAPEVPAVLLEMGFITSPEDEKLLSNRESRDRVIQAVSNAIDAFFAQQTRLASN